MRQLSIAVSIERLLKNIQNLIAEKFIQNLQKASIDNVEALLFTFKCLNLTYLYEFILHCCGRIQTFFKGMIP